MIRARPKTHNASSGWRIIGSQRQFYRSRWESNVARWLEYNRRNGRLRSWRHECETFRFGLLFRGVTTYKPDFTVTELNGRLTRVEVKGHMDQRSRVTMKRMKKYHPDVRIKLIDRPAYRAIEGRWAPFVDGWEFDPKKPRKTKKTE